MIKHRISASIEGQRIDGWSEYEIDSSMIDAADRFMLRRPFEADAFRLLVPDGKIKIKIDDTTIIEGFIDDREREASRSGDTVTITGRDKVGRLVQESAPTVNYAGELTDVVKQLISPWFDEVALSDVRNRTVRLGKRRAAAAPNEAIVKTVKIKKSWMGTRWRLQPGQARWKIIAELVSEAGYMVWSSADGKEIVIGQPDYAQPISYLVCAPRPGSSLSSTAIRLSIKESTADRFSLIMALGSGTGDAANYGAATTSMRNTVKNFDSIDGTGLDFLYPKRLILAERSLKNLEEAHAHAQRDMDRRDFHKNIANATLPGHGQMTAGQSVSLFAPNTMARVVDERQDLPIDAPYLVFACKYKGKREEQTTDLQMVPKGTKFAI